MSAAAAEPVLAALCRMRPTAAPVRFEIDLHVRVAEALAEASVRFHREVTLGPGCRIDFLCEGGVGIEVKKGKASSAAVAAQVARYCEFDEVSCLVIFVERLVFDPPAEAAGKPVHYVALNRLAGVALY